MREIPNAIECPNCIFLKNNESQSTNRASKIQTSESRPSEDSGASLQQANREDLYQMDQAIKYCRKRKAIDYIQYL